MRLTVWTIADRILSMSTRRPWLPWVVWSFAVLAYVIAIVNRSSFSALGLEAQRHFGVDATVLSSFMVIQLLVYAGCQIPVGLLLDRFGASIIIMTGGVLMAAGQIMMATVSELWLAIVARILVGAGDACTFICVIRMLGEWFPVKTLPIVSQMTGQIGQGGQIISVVPLSLAVGNFGWMAGFLGLTAVGLLVTVLGFFVIRDYPGQRPLAQRVFRRGPAPKRNLGQTQLSSTSILTDSIPVITSTMMAQAQGPMNVFSSIRSLLKKPGIRLAYWVHFSTPFAVHVIMLLWGTPFFISAMNMSAQTSATLLTTCIVASIVGGLLLGPVTARYALQRMWVVVIGAAMILVAWVTVLLVPGASPLWLMFILVIIVGLGGPTSMVAFEVLRTHAPPRQLGVATGLVNTGGFTSALVAIFAIGFVLDLQGAGTPETYTTTAFKFAMAVQIPLLVLGLVMMLVEWPKAKRDLGETGIIRLRG